MGRKSSSGSKGSKGFRSKKGSQLGFSPPPQSLTKPLTSINETKKISSTSIGFKS